MTKALFIPHANIQYSQLPPEKREWVIRQSYERLFDLIAANPAYKVGFEASGATLQIMDAQCPDVVAKLRKLIQAGQVEAIGSPYTHIMLGNIDPEIGLYSLKRGREAWKTIVGVEPKLGWNPECSWASFLPEIFKEAGYEALVMDGDSFMLSFEAIRLETGLRFDVRGHSNKNQLFKIEKAIAEKPELLKFFTNVSVANNGLKLLMRSDSMANPMLWYLMGATEGHREVPVDLSEIRGIFNKWKSHITQSGSFILPYAEDAEYIGTSAYFYVKQFGQARFFEPEPESVTRFKELLDTALSEGFELCTPSEILNATASPVENPYIENVERGIAWHGGTSLAWANTDYARIMDPVCRLIHEGIKTLKHVTEGSDPEVTSLLASAFSALESSYVSDSRWPPKPTSPGRFNVNESLVDLANANEFLSKAMQAAGIQEKRSLYSPELMRSQIESIREELMEKPYFGE